MRISPAITDLVFERAAVSGGEFSRPAIPGLEFLTRTKRIEQNKIVEPPGSVFLKGFESPECVCGTRTEKSASGLEEQRHFLREDAVVLYAGGRRRQGVEFSAIDPASIRQAIETNQKRISGEGRSRGIGRISVPQGAERQDLPQALAGGCEKVGELVGGR